MERVCESNRDMVKRHYVAYLQREDHGESSFNKFLNENFGEVCPSDGVITYEDGYVECGIHKGAGEDGSPGGEVPWL